MKDENRNLINLARDYNRHNNDYRESQERRLRQDHNNRERQKIFQDGYGFGKKGLDFDSIEYPNKEDRSFMQGYRQGLEDYKAQIQVNSNQKIQKSR